MGTRARVSPPAADAKTTDALSSRFTQLFVAACVGETTDALPNKLKWYFAAACIGAWGPLSVWTAHRTTLFVVYYQTSVGAMGVIQICAAFIDALNGPIVGHLADSAFINQRFPCFPLRTWGRRAPLLTLGTPLMIVGPALMWLAPSRDPAVTSFWYALCYFLFVNGNTVTLQSYLASIQELFGTSAERALAIARQTPFMVITYALAGGVPMLVAFTTNPDDGERCCVTKADQCEEAPPCGCYAAPLLPNLTIGAHNLSGAYEPTYAAVCHPSHGELNASVAALSLAAVASARSDACDKPSVDLEQQMRFISCAVLTVLLGLMLYLAVPPTRHVARLTPPTRASAASGSGAKPPSLWTALSSTLRRRAFQVYTSMMLLSITYATFFGANIPLYLVYILGLEPREVPAVAAALGLSNLFTRVACVPLYTRATIRYPKHAHPARLLAYVRLGEAIVVPIMLWLLGQNVGLFTVAFIAGLLTGILHSPFDMCSHLLIGWAIDEDALANGGNRREGMHYAANGMIQHLSGAINGLVLVAWGAAGFDAKLCAHQQPAAARSAIESSFLIGLPLLSFLTALVAMFYPIQGERLRRLLERTEQARHGKAKVQVQPAPPSPPQPASIESQKEVPGDAPTA